MEKREEFAIVRFTITPSVVIRFILIVFVGSTVQLPSPGMPVGPVQPVLPVGPVAPSPCENVTFATGPTGQLVSVNMARPRGAILVVGDAVVEVQNTLPLIMYLNIPDTPEFPVYKILSTIVLLP